MLWLHTNHLHATHKVDVRACEQTIQLVHTVQVCKLVFQNKISLTTRYSKSVTNLLDLWQGSDQS